MTATKEIPLTKGKVAIVDADMYDYLMQWKWHFTDSGCNIPGYARRKEYVNGKQKTILMHRVILGVVNTTGRVVCDHINGNGLDNTRENLRLCTVQENNRNRRSKPNSSSKYLGVYWDKGRCKWGASISFRCKNIRLGFFKNEEEAALAYNQAASFHFREFARLNVLPNCGTL